jgi:hypothetical protein
MPNPKKKASKRKAQTKKKIRGKRIKRISEGNRKRSVDKFIVDAIETLRVPPKKGIHVVYSGFNEAFRKHFPEFNPIEETRRMEDEGKLHIKPSRGGAIIYKSSELPASFSNNEEEILKKILKKGKGEKRTLEDVVRDARKRTRKKRS